MGSVQQTPHRTGSGAGGGTGEGRARKVATPKMSAHAQVEPDPLRKPATVEPLPVDRRRQVRFGSSEEGAAGARVRTSAPAQVAARLRPLVHQTGIHLNAPRFHGSLGARYSKGSCAAWHRTTRPSGKCSTDVETLPNEYHLQSRLQQNPRSPLDIR